MTQNTEAATGSKAYDPPGWNGFEGSDWGASIDPLPRHLRPLSFDFFTLRGTLLYALHDFPRRDVTL